MHTISQKIIYSNIIGEKQDHIIKQHNNSLENTKKVD